MVLQLCFHNFKYFMPKFSKRKIFKISNDDLKIIFFLIKIYIYLKKNTVRARWYFSYIEVKQMKLSGRRKW